MAGQSTNITPADITVSLKMYSTKFRSAQDIAGETDYRPDSYGFYVTFPDFLKIAYAPDHIEFVRNLVASYPEYKEAYDHDPKKLRLRTNLTPPSLKTLSIPQTSSTVAGTTSSSGGDNQTSDCELYDNISDSGAEGDDGVTGKRSA